MTPTIAPAAMITSEDLEKRFSPAVQDVLGRVLDLWLASYRDELGPFLKISKDLAKRIAAISPGEPSLVEVWPQLEKTFNEYLDWARSLKVENDDFLSRQFLETWKSEARRVGEGFPARTELPIEDAFWVAKDGDPLRVRAWKWAIRRRHGLRRSYFRIRNAGRKIIRKQPVAPGTPVRGVQLKDFLEFHLAIPVARLLFSEWQRFLQKAAADLYQFHVASESIENDSLFSAEDTESRILPSAAGAAMRKEKVGKDIEDLVGQFGRIEGFKDEAHDRVSKAWGGIAAEVRESWGSAGTFAHSNRRFGRAAIEKGWRRLEGDLERAREAWRRHYAGEIDEWQKDLALSVLQLQTTRFYRETAGSVGARIGEGIIPPLESLAGTISAYTKTIRESLPRTKSDLKKVIVTENGALLANLREDHLPVVVDSLVSQSGDRRCR